MVVDDEGVIGTMLQDALTYFGYRVQTFESPVSALHAFNSAPDQVDLVITDLTMPELTGADLAQRIWMIRPELPVVLMTGYTESFDEVAAQEAGWDRGFHWPWEALRNHWDVVWRPTPDHPEWVWLFRAELVSWVVGVGVTLVALFRRRVAEAAWVGVQVLAFSLSYWLMSVNRAVLLWFPLWRQVGEFVESRPATTGWKVVGVLVGLVALAVQGVWAWLYFTGRWSS